MSKKPAHNKKGNCWSRDAYLKCRKMGCRPGEMCDVCHLHDEPRGECSECDTCAGCEDERKNNEPGKEA